MAKILLNYETLLNNKEQKEKLKQKLFNLLNDEDRYVHSLSVAKLCRRIAESNNLEEPLKYYFAGLFHDCCKNISKEELSKICEREYDSGTYSLIPKYAYHAFACPYELHELFEYDDYDLDNAVRYHCTGRDNMSTLEKVLYASDKIEPTRGYNSNYMINMMLEDFEKGFLIVLRENKIFLSKKSGAADNNNYFTKKCYKYYLEKE